MKITLKSFRNAIKTAIVKEAAISDMGMKLISMPSLGVLGNVHETKPSGKGAKKFKKNDPRNVLSGDWHSFKAGKK